MSGLRRFLRLPGSCEVERSSSTSITRQDEDYELSLLSSSCPSAQSQVSLPLAQLSHESSSEVLEEVKEEEKEGAGEEDIEVEVEVSQESVALATPLTTPTVSTKQTEQHRSRSRSKKRARKREDSGSETEQVCNSSSSSSSPSSSSSSASSCCSYESPTLLESMELGYTALNELRGMLQERLHHRREFPSVYGVVQTFSPPQVITKTGHWFCHVTLMDESLPLPPDANNQANQDETSTENKPSCVIPLNIFATTRSGLPPLCKVGDVLRAHRVDLKQWSGDVQLTGSPRFHTSLVVYRTNQQHDQHHFFSTAKNKFTLQASDKRRFQALWAWGQQRLAFLPTETVARSFALSRMTDNNHDDHNNNNNTNSFSDHLLVEGDLTALVTAIIPHPTDPNTASHPLGYLRLWDGTGNSLSDPPPIQNDTANEATRQGHDPPLAALKSIANAMDKLNETSKAPPTMLTSRDDQKDAWDRVLPTTELQPPTQLCGRVVNAVVWEKLHWMSLIEGPTPSPTTIMEGGGGGAGKSASQSLEGFGLKVGQFVRLRNIRSGIYKVNDERLQVAGGTYDVHQKRHCLMIHSKSSCTPLPDTTYEVRQLLLAHQRRVERGDPYNESCAVMENPGTHYDMSAVAAPTPTFAEETASHECSQDNSWTQQQSRAVLSTPVFSPLLTETSNSSGEEIFSLAECLGEPAPSTFVIRARVLKTIPEVSLASSSLSSDGWELEKLCVPNLEVSLSKRHSRKKLKNDKRQKTPQHHRHQSYLYQFALRLKDASAELDAIIPNKVALKMFGVPATEVCIALEGQARRSQDQRLKKTTSRRAVWKQLSLVLDGTSIWEGRMQSVRMNNEKYFILDDFVKVT